MNSNTNKLLKHLQEQYDQFLIDLDPTTTDAKIGHTTTPLPDENEITDSSDELVSQKSFIPDEAKQYSKIKNNDNLLGNKQIDDEEKKYINQDYQNKEILNIGEGKRKVLVITTHGNVHSHKKESTSNNLQRILAYLLK